MLSGCWIAALLLLLLPPGTRGQSGDQDQDRDQDRDQGRDRDREPAISCTSHILTASRSSLSCKLLAGRSAGEDDEDGEADGVERMAVCFNDAYTNRRECREAAGDTVTGLRPLPALNVSVHLRTGRTISTTVDLMKIIKPLSPQVRNVTFDRESNLAEFHIGTPYGEQTASRREYLRPQSQLFELLIWAAGSTITQNVSADTLRIDLTRLRRHREWRVRVRALPVNGLQGTWSEWSDAFRFCPPAEETVPAGGGRDVYKLVVCLVVLLVVPSIVALFWKNKIFSYVWPSIPHPKHTLVHICKPNKGLLLNFRPEVFSALRVENPEDPPREEAEPAPAAGGAPTEPPCSAQSSACSRSTTSAGTEELELSALLSRTSSDGEDSLRSAGPSPVQDLRPGDGAGPDCSGAGSESEAYVTMSSFYQVK